VARKVQFGICRLCLQQRELRRSHFLSAFLYRKSLQRGMINPHPVMMTNSRAALTTFQVKDYLLCASCESRFDKYGERWAAGHVYDGKYFPLLQRLNLSLPLLETSQFLAVSGVAAGIDTGKLGYFGLSILWRAAAHRWTMLDGQTTLIDLGSYEEPIRKFLLGEAGLPSNIIVVATACTDWLSWGSFYPPCSVPGNPYTTYAFLARGIHFRVLAGNVLPAEIRELCCVASAMKPVFAANHEAKSVHAFLHLFRTASLTNVSQD